LRTQAPPWEALLAAGEAAIVLFLSINPFTWIPLFVRKTQGLHFSEIRKLCLTISLTVLAILALSFGLGRIVLKLLGLSPNWLGTALNEGWVEISVGLILLILVVHSLALRNKSDSRTPRTMTAAYSVFPFSFPLLAGPTTITPAIYYSLRADTFEKSITMTIFMALIAFGLFLILMHASKIAERLGHRGMRWYSLFSNLLLAAVGLLLLSKGIVQMWNDQTDASQARISFNL